MYMTRKCHSRGECGMPQSFCMGVWGTCFPPMGDRLDPHTPTHSNFTTNPDKQAHIYHSYILCDALQCMQHVGTTVVGNVGCPSPSVWECGVPVSPPWGIGWIPTLPHIPTLLQIPTSRLISITATSFVMLSNACNTWAPQSWGMWDAPVLLYGSVGYPFPPRGG